MVTRASAVEIKRAKDRLDAAKMAVAKARTAKAAKSARDELELAEYNWRRKNGFI